MSGMTVNNIDRGSVIIEDDTLNYIDDTLMVAATTTLVAGTILARDSVSLKLVPFVKGGVTNQNGIPKTVLIFDVENTGGAPADFPVRVPNSAKVNKTRLVIDADGDDSNIDAAVRDQLRVYGIDPIDAVERNIPDNQ
jgi:hypothetical protein